MIGTGPPALCASDKLFDVQVLVNGHHGRPRRPIRDSLLDTHLHLVLPNPHKQSLGQLQPLEFEVLEAVETGGHVLVVLVSPAKGIDLTLVHLALERLPLVRGGSGKLQASPLVIVHRVLGTQLTLFDARLQLHLLRQHAVLEAA